MEIIDFQKKNDKNVLILLRQNQAKEGRHSGNQSDDHWGFTPNPSKEEGKAPSSLHSPDHPSAIIFSQVFKNRDRFLANLVKNISEDLSKKEIRQLRLPDLFFGNSQTEPSQRLIAEMVLSGNFF